MSNERMSYERWITIFPGLAMFVVALIGLYFQKVQVDGASGRLIAEMNEKIDKLQTSVNERLEKVEQPQKVVALEKQISEMKSTLVSLETKYKTPEEKKVLTDRTSLLTQKQIKLSDYWKTPLGTQPLPDLLTQSPAKTPELSKKFSFLKEDDKNLVTGQFDSMTRTQDLLKYQTPLTIAPLTPPESKPWYQQFWETLKANPTILVILVFLGIAASRK